MERELESDTIVDNLITWKKIRRSTDRAVSILYVLDVAPEIKDNEKAINALLHELGHINRAAITEPYITAHNSEDVVNDTEKKTSKRFLLMGAPGELSDRQKTRLKKMFVQNKTNKNDNHIRLRRVIKNRRP